MSLVSSDLNQDKMTLSSCSPSSSKDCNTKIDKAKVIPNLPELINGKVVFKQKPISFENLSETMQEIVSFRGWLEASDGPLETIPDNYLPLIAKLVHESDKSVALLAKALQFILFPPTLEASARVEALGFSTSPVVEEAIKAVAERINYGISTNLDRSPAALCVWRWEVKNRDWLPKSVRDKACQRFHERVAARNHLQTLFAALPSKERDSILKNGKIGKSTQRRELVTNYTGVEVEVSGLPQQKEKEEAAGYQGSTKKPSGSKKLIDLDTVTKDKEREERKAIKAEKEKKDAEAKKKSAAVFANFFKPGTSCKPNKPLFTTFQTRSPASSSSTTAHLNEFELTFKSFVVKKDAQLAPVNWFIAEKRCQRQQFLLGSKEKATDRQTAIIELDDEGREVQISKHGNVSMDVDTERGDVAHLSPRAVLQTFLNSQPPSLHPNSHGLPTRRKFKAAVQHSVREIMYQLNVAEVQGDQRVVRRLTGLLRNRQKIPAKVFVFAENNRPGYIGTWTRNSSVIDPRTPFTRDLLSFDYDHDSDAEWEEEEGGEDIESLDGSMEDDLSSAGSDLDDWLIEGDEIEVEPVNIQDEPDRLPSNPNSVKRKAAGSREAHNKKRKVVPLVPFQKGPSWEKDIGDYDGELFKPMRIQLFNDTPFPIDPFTFITDGSIPERTYASAVRKGDDNVFVMPALPERLLSNPIGLADPSASDSCVKRKVPNAVPPKTTFPNAHVPLLLQRIGVSTTNSFAVLLDSVFQDLKPFGIKKNALEVKLREVSEKDKVKKGWVIKEEAWARHGLVRPA